MGSPPLHPAVVLLPPHRIPHHLRPHRQQVLEVNPGKPIRIRPSKLLPMILLPSRGISKEIPRDDATQPAPGQSPLPDMVISQRSQGFLVQNILPVHWSRITPSDPRISPTPIPSVQHRPSSSSASGEMCSPPSVSGYARQWWEKGEHLSSGQVVRRSVSPPRKDGKPCIPALLPPQVQEFCGESVGEDEEGGGKLLLFPRGVSFWKRLGGYWARTVFREAETGSFPYTTRALTDFHDLASGEGWIFPHGLQLLVGDRTDQHPMRFPEESHGDPVNSGSYRLRG